jgi:hypothetical protein
MCIFGLLIIVAVLLGFAALGIALICGATAGVAIGIGLVTWVLILVIGVLYIFFGNPDLLSWGS